ncbi:MAG: hypothetical protein ACUVRX_02585 [Actinomycetota bacterium]
MIPLRVMGLFLVLCIPGWALLFLLTGGSRARTAERAWFSLVAGTGLISLEALLLGYLSMFGTVPFLLTLGLLGVSLVVAAAIRWKRIGKEGKWRGIAGGHRGREAATLAALLLLGFALFAPPWRIVSGFSDVGIYPAMAANLVREGRWWVENRTATEIAPEHVDLVYHAVRMNYGETVYHENQFYAFENLSKGREWPLFFHLWPSLLAVFAVFLGLENMFWALTWVSVLALWGFFLLARRFLGEWWAWAAVVLAAVCPVVIYFGRYTGSEVMNALLFLGGTLCVHKYLDEEISRPGIVRGGRLSASRKGYGWAALAGFLLSLGFLCRVDFLFILVPVAVFMIFKGILEGIDGPDWLFLGISVAGALSAVATGNAYAHVYFNKIWRSFVGGSGIALMVGASVLMVLIFGVAFLPWHLRRFLRRVLRMRQVWVPLLWVALTILFAWLYFLRPRSVDPTVSYGFIKAIRGSSFRSQDFLRWAWYFSPLGLVAIFAGYALCLGCRRSAGDKIMALCGFSFSVFYALNMRALPLHILAMRRLVPVILFVGMLMIVLAVSTIAEAGRRIVRRIPVRAGHILPGWVLSVTAAGLFLYLIAYMANASLPLWGMDEGGNQWEAVEMLSEEVPSDAVLLMDYHSGDHFGVPLRNFHGVENVWLKEDTMFDPDKLALLLADLGFPERELYLLWRPSISGERLYLPPGVEAVKVLSFPVREYALERSFERRPRERRNPLEIYRVYKLITAPSEGGVYRGC